ncbi:NADH dehydrogenase, FAD-containing subunit [Monaibacterium marinum]|uniref:NADH dehydrogenase, FAD-containing subunit n=1 Tax=Pontivivens marinum TaxID=1690039 RepID=A0A2C9CT33_9RHOB|nr:FAD-dependent oxidoreductase [Monaibacterium marinum]SOH94325.1 NADH dehydrogenase, FAD-containing subunit [Monaibacterium marinum]
MAKRIAIVGGGAIGAELAKSLEASATVTLIEQCSHYVHAPAMIRAVVEPSILDQALIPYDTLLTQGTFVQARAVSIDAGGVQLNDGSRIDADYIVVATGSENATPFKPKGADIAGLRADNARIHEMLKAASTVAIVGAGAVGTELAGEIAHFTPEKKIKLISSDATLFPQMPKRLGRSLEKKLVAAGVEVILGARAMNLENMTEPYAGVLELTNGQSVQADLIFPAIGSRGSSELLRALPDVKMGTANRAITDQWMRPSSLPNIFAAGDVAEMGDAMTVVATTRQLPWLIKTLKTVLVGQKIEDQKPYTPWKKAPILIPLGPFKGNSFLSLFTAGDFLTRQIKGKDLFLKKRNNFFDRN